MAPSNGPIHGKMDDGNGLTGPTLGKNGETNAFGVLFITIPFVFVLILLSIACMDFFYSARPHCFLE
jgi:hypothetical protein